MQDANIVSSINMLYRGGPYLVPADSGVGGIRRPMAQGEQGGKVATLETLFEYFINNVPQCDEAKALDPGIERKLRFHPDVVAAMRKRAFTVSSMPWRIDPNPQCPPGMEGVAKEVARYVSDVWARIPRLRQLYHWLEAAVLIGGQGIEFVWHRAANGIEYPVEFQPVHMSRFMFDRLGNMALLTRDQAVWGVYVRNDPQAQYSKQFPQGKFIYHQYMQGQATWDQPYLAGYTYYGIGEDVSLYYAVYFDFFVWRFRMKWLEKYGLPPTILYHPENRVMTGQVLRICDSLRDESIVSIPRNVGGEQGTPDSLYKVEQMPVPSMTQDAFAEYQRNYTKPKIDAILLGSSEEGQKSEGKGGYADHVSRHDTGPMIWFRWDAGNINDTLNNQLIPAIVLQRFPNLSPELWPKHVLEPKEEKDRAAEIDIIEKTSSLVPVPEDYVYEVTGIPKPQGGENTIGGPQAPETDGLGMPQPGALKPQPGKPGIEQARRANGLKAPVGQGSGNGKFSLAGRV